MRERQSKFVENIAKGMSSADACREARYDCNGASAHADAHRLRQRDDVKAEIERLRAASESETIMSILEMREALTRLLKVAEGNEDMSGFSQLADRLSKVSGYYEPTRTESTGEIEIVIGGSEED